MCSGSSCSPAFSCKSRSTTWYPYPQRLPGVYLPQPSAGLSPGPPAREGACVLGPVSFPTVTSSHPPRHTCQLDGARPTGVQEEGQPWPQGISGPIRCCWPMASFLCTALHDQGCLLGSEREGG